MGVAVVTSLERSNYHPPGKLEVLHSSPSNPLLHLARGQGGEAGDSHRGTVRATELSTRRAKMH